MALNFALIESVTQDFYVPKLEDAIYESSALLTMLRRDGRVQRTGTDIKLPLLYAKNTARGRYSGYDVLDTTPPDNITAAQFELKNYYASVSISGDDERKNSGDRAVLKILQSKMADAENTLKDLVGTDLFTGTTHIIGLDSAIGTTNTYGGIDGNTYSWWRSTVDTTAHTGANMLDSTNASYIHKLLRAGYKACRHLGNVPNLIVTSQDIYDIYEQTLQVNARYNMSARGQFLADAGFSVIEFRGIPIVVDDFVDDSADAMYMLNTNFMDLWIHPDANFKFSGFVRPGNQDARTGQILFSGQLTISNRRMFARWSDLNN